jgi:hypothetical protein
MLRDRCPPISPRPLLEGAGFPSIGALPAQPLDGFNYGFGKRLGFVRTHRAPISFLARHRLLAVGFAVGVFVAATPYGWSAGLLLEIIAPRADGGQ